jgi:S1-C subfamily serine protease
MREGRVRRSRLGIAAETIMLDSRLAQRLHHPARTAVMVSDVVADGPAERGGMQKGDLVLKVDDKPLCGVDDLHRLLTAEVAGTMMTVELLRSGRLAHLSITPVGDDERATP